MRHDSCDILVKCHNEMLDSYKEATSPKAHINAKLVVLIK